MKIQYTRITTMPDKPYVLFVSFNSTYALRYVIPAYRPSAIFDYGGLMGIAPPRSRNVPARRRSSTAATIRANSSYRRAQSTRNRSITVDSVFHGAGPKLRGAQGQNKFFFATPSPRFFVIWKKK